MKIVTRHATSLVETRTASCTLSMDDLVTVTVFLRVERYLTPNDHVSSGVCDFSYRAWLEVKGSGAAHDLTHTLGRAHDRWTDLICGWPESALDAALAEARENAPHLCADQFHRIYDLFHAATTA